jgi:hypothetical protein
MAGQVTSGIKRFVLWDYPRASWPYDIMVGLILAFIFLTPREWFRDQPRIPQARDIAMLPSDRGTNAFWVEPELLIGIAEDQRVARLGTILKDRTGKKQSVTRVEPIYDSEHEIKGYIVFTRP